MFIEPTIILGLFGVLWVHMAWHNNIVFKKQDPPTEQINTTSFSSDIWNRKLKNFLKPSDETGLSFWVPISAYKLSTVFDAGSTIEQTIAIEVLGTRFENLEPVVVTGTELLETRIENLEPVVEQDSETGTGCWAHHGHRKKEEPEFRNRTGCVASHGHRNWKKQESEICVALHGHRNWKKQEDKIQK